jgi:homoserine kinase
MRVHISIPASAGNIGSAFDTLGLAYGLYNEVIVDTAAPGSFEAEGEGAEHLRSGTQNLVTYAIDRFAKETGRVVPPHGMKLVNRIPFWRGLGSSAAAIVGGLLAADALTESRLKREELLHLALLVEDHPDNVSAALFGSALLTVFHEGHVEGPFTTIPLQVPAHWRAVLFVPDLHLPTKEAREILPRMIPRQDAVFNQSRVGLLIAAFTQGRPELLKVAMQDRIHQPYRAKLFPEMDALIQAGIDGGAWGACLSGAGSAILALCSDSKAAQAAASMEQRAQWLKVPGRSMVLEIPKEGAKVQWCG